MVEEELKVLRAVSAQYPFDWDFDEFPWSSQYYKNHGRMMPSDALDMLARYDTVFLGAVGHPDTQDHILLLIFYQKMCFSMAI